jgi:hypothetical protein
MKEGYSKWDSEIYWQEGLNKQSLHQSWKDTAASTIDKLLATNVTDKTPYIIPPISHVVYFTNPDNPKQWKELYTNKYTKTTERLSKQDHNMKHYIWTNDPNTVPANVKAIPNVEIRTFDEFKNHELTPSLNKLLEEAKADSNKFVQASDVARVLTQQAYGGVYHDLDYEVFDAAGLIKYMKLASFVGGKEVERHDSFMGNAFIASTAHHPVINELATTIKRNLNLEKGVPDYIKYPLNKFDSVLCSTGPAALTLAYFKVQNQKAAEGHELAPQLMLPSRILYSKEYARKEIGPEIIASPPEGVLGGDMFAANWETDEYKKTLVYPAVDIDKGKSQAALDKYLMARIKAGVGISAVNGAGKTAMNYAYSDEARDMLTAVIIVCVLISFLIVGFMHKKEPKTIKERSRNQEGRRGQRSSKGPSGYEGQGSAATYN